MDEILNTPFPANIHCLTTPRYLTGGAGRGDYDNFNLATHTGDDPKTVAHNRQLLKDYYRLPNAPKWLNQTHSDCALCADDIENNPDGDASWTKTKGVVCAVLTADCLPIFIGSAAGDCVGIIHAGFQGLLNGVIAGLVKSAPLAPEQTRVHLGVGISHAALALDAAMYRQFIEKDPHYQNFFKADDGRYFLDMPALAIYQFKKMNIHSISQTAGCTYAEPKRYFSYRRQGAHSGRMASLIWFD